ncbi:tape measure protein [Microbacterium sp. LWH7-1.2]|uniref:tape measure protein n=1 Tax=Microbacterium sp. LWH7-1.2 TaxID=3135257 RepID=UPI003139ACA8
MALDIGTLVAKVTVDDSDFDKKTSGWSAKGAGIASAFGNVAADAISTATSALVNYVGDAAAASDATDKFAKTLEFAGVDGKNIDALKKKTQDYADSTTYSLGDIQSITAQLAANGVEGYDSLAMSLGNLNAVAGGSPETFGRVGSVLTQTAGAGKLTTENWNQLAEAIPGASGVLQQALADAGAYTGNFRDAMAEGQITAEEFNAAIQQVGTDPIAVEAAESTKTFEGAAGNLAATIQGQLVKALEVIKPAFTAFQGALAWFIGNSGLLVPLISGIGVALLVVLAPALWAAVTATAAWTVALLANPMTWIVLGIVALVAAIVWLIQNWDTATKFLTDVWAGFVSWFTAIVDGLVSWWTGVWEGFISWTTGVIDGFVGWWNGVWSAIGSFFTSMWDGVVAFAKGLFQFYIGWLVNLIVFFVANWDAIWSRVGSIIADVWSGIVDWFTSIPGAINDLLTGAGRWLYNIGRDIINGLWEGLKSVWQSVSSWFENTFGGIVDTIAGIFGIHSPSRVMREYIMGNVAKGAILGLNDHKSDIEQAFRDTMAMPTDTGLNSARRGGGGTGPVTTTVKNITYNAVENQSLSAEEALYAALGSPRVKD